MPDIIEESEPSAEEVLLDWSDIRADARADIDTVIHAYNFLDEIDAEAPDILQWNLKRKVRNAKKNCLLILCKSIEDLAIESEEENTDN